MDQYVEITKGSFTNRDRRYLLRLYQGPKYIACDFADTLRGARRKARRMLANYQFNEEVRL